MNPELLNRVQHLEDIGVAISFVNFITATLIAGKVSEQKVREYCEEKENAAAAGHYAKPKYGYSKVPSRSVKKTQFWYAK